MAASPGRSSGSGRNSVDAPPRSHGRSMRRAALIMLAAAVLLAAGHVALARAWPWLTQAAPGSAASASLLDTPELRNISLALYVANIFVLGSALLGRQRLSSRRAVAYVIGYVAVVWLLWSMVRIMPENLLLLTLALLAYGSLLHHPYLLGYLYLFLACQRFLPAYLYASFLLTSLLYATLQPVVRSWRRDRARFVPLCHLTGLIFLTSLLIPIVFYCTQSSVQDIHLRLGEAEVQAALGRSVRTSALATMVVLLLGVPLAYAIVRTRFPGRGLIDALIDLPIVIPPPIVGLTLLAFLGPKSPLGAFLESDLGLRFEDSEWRIVIVQVFVGSPYLIRASMVAFSAVDVRYENVARTLGASPLSAFARITLPMSLRGIIIGVMLTWFRAMGEYGALRIFAEHPRTIPILTYDWYIAFGQTESQPVGVLMLLLCLAVIVGMWIIRSLPTLLGKTMGVSDAAG